MAEQAAEARADLCDLHRSVDAAIVDVHAVGDAAFVKRTTQRLDECVGVFCEKELAVAADAAGIVDEGDESGLRAFAAVLHVRPVHGVGLPHVVSVGFGEGETAFVWGFRVRFEEFVVFDDAAEGVGGDLLAPEEAALDADAIDGSDVAGLAVE